ncbi:hypothetical protein [Dactylosporangium darangshiense]|uniref:hypothetical protein n=1 Tax=Dactylosporangium darangshiense TaxID=579108 RepID=UPI0036260ABA
MQQFPDHPRSSRSLGDWLVLGALVHRTLVNPIIFLGSTDVLGELTTAHLAVVALLTVVNAGLTAWALTGRQVILLRSPAFMACDLLVTVAVNIGSAAALPPNRILLPYCDIFWLYATSTAALWTIIRGPRTGALLLSAGAGLPSPWRWSTGLP